MTAKHGWTPKPVSSFYDYFETKTEPAAVLAAFGYALDAQKLTLPRFDGPIPWAQTLATEIERLIPRVSLTSEKAKREFLIAPLLRNIALHFDIRIHPEFSLEVRDTLKGSLDYLLEGHESLVVIEAKQGDMFRGFRQLAVELIAVDEWVETSSTMLYGCITIGDVWRFAVLHREQKRIVQDINLYTMPADVESLARGLIGILEGGKRWEE
jgi:hypothetical protein